ncbi:MAG: EamA family transporter [Phototrophicaceae bacterium]
MIWGLGASLAWGVGYVVSRQPTRTLGTLRLLFYTDLLVLIATSVYVLVRPQEQAVLIGAGAAAWGFAIGYACLNGVANLVFVRSIEIGVLAIVTPISATYAVFIVLLTLLTGESLTVLQGIGCTGAFIGVALTSISPTGLTQADAHKGKRSAALTGALLAIVGATLYGVAYWIMGKFVVPSFGSVLPLWISRWVSLALTLTVVVFSRAPRGIQLPEREAWLGLALSTALIYGGFVLNNIGYSRANIALVSVLASTYSAVTAVLAALFLKERLAFWQWIGIAVIISSIIIVTIL